MATGHGPLSKVYKMEPQRQKKNNDEQYGSGFNAVCANVLVTSGCHSANQKIMIYSHDTLMGGEPKN